METEIFEKPAEEAQMQVLPTSALHAQIKAEMDSQIITAKQYPRNIKAVLKKIEDISISSKETAESCFYALPRGGKTISGPSIRFAEIVLNSWGNIKAAARIIADDGKTITAQGICIDLESNASVSTEVKRRVVGKDGRRYTDDMVIVACNAACAIAIRNAVFRVIPLAITEGIQGRIKEVAIGKSLDLETSRQNAMEYFKRLGVTEAELFAVLDVSALIEIGTEQIFTLKGLKTALADGETTIEQAFGRIKGENAELTDEIKEEAAKIKTRKDLDAFIEARQHLSGNLAFRELIENKKKELTNAGKSDSNATGTGKPKGKAGKQLGIADQPE